LLCVGIVKRVRARRVVAALRVGTGSRIGKAAAVLGVKTSCSPEHVVVLVVDVFHSDVILGKLFITFTECSFAASSLVSADWSVVSDSEVVSHKFSDAHFSVCHSCAFLAVFVLLADVIELVNWRSVAGIGHWSIAEDETLATVSPVFSLVKVGIVEVHLVHKLTVSTSIIRSLTTSSSKRRLGGRSGEEDGGG